jgi:hypothetical protein
MLLEQPFLEARAGAEGRDSTVPIEICRTSAISW